MLYSFPIKSPLLSINYMSYVYSIVYWILLQGKKTQGSKEPWVFELLLYIVIESIY